MTYKGLAKMGLVTAVGCLIATGSVLAVAQNFILDVLPGARNIEELTDESALVVEAVVVSVFPSATVENRRQETDALLRPLRVIKGPNQDAPFVVSQIGGNGMTTRQYSLMKPDEQYLLFLRPVSSARMKILPVRQGIVRWGFADAGMILSSYRLDGDKVHLNPDLPLGFRNMETSRAKLLASIESHVQASSGKP